MYFPAWFRAFPYKCLLENRNHEQISKLMKNMKSKITPVWLTLFSALVALPSATLYGDDDDGGTAGEPHSLDEAIVHLQQGGEDVDVYVEGIPVELMDEDDYLFVIGETEIVLDLWNEDVVLPIGEAIRVTGELEWADDDDQSAGYLYELEAKLIEDLDGNLIARADVDDIHDDDGDDHNGKLIPIDEAIARLKQGWDEAYVFVEGVPVELIDDDDYLFVIGDTEVILELWDDDVVLPIGEAIRVSGELEWADDDDQAAGLLYELDAMWIEDLAGNRIGDDDSDDDHDDDYQDKDYGKRAEGTLAELVDLLEASDDDDLNVRTKGILGELVSHLSDDDDDYRFSDGSGVTVILDLDSRSDLSFDLTPGMELEIIGELERVDDDEDVPADIMYELDAIWIRLADGPDLDLGQFSPLDGSTISDWMGYFWKIDDDDWYFHPSKGILFSDDKPGEDDWYFSFNLEAWVFVSRDLYPLAFSMSDGWFYLVGSPYGEKQHAYSFDDDEWILDFWRKGP